MAGELNTSDSGEMLKGIFVPFVKRKAENVREEGKDYVTIGAGGIKLCWQTCKMCVVLTKICH